MIGDSIHFTKITSIALFALFSLLRDMFRPKWTSIISLIQDV